MPAKQIPLFRDKNNIQDYILENLFVSNGSVYELDSNLVLTKAEDDDQITQANDRFKQFKAINKYVTVNNKILPQSEALYAKITNEFTKAELVWVQSVFNGKDFDNAYKTARNLAIDKDWDRALLLSNYILNKIPRHADTEVLIGRIHSWKQDYSTSIEVLSEAIRKYPTYTDAYSALLDTYYWANKSEQAVGLFKTILSNNISSPEIEEKIARAKKQIGNNALEKAAKEAKKEANIASVNKQ
jgi:tetratricopeptide (TPR) repeat protein